MTLLTSRTAAALVIELRGQMPSWAVGVVPTLVVLWLFLVVLWGPAATRANMLLRQLRRLLQRK
jgi:hypothetical protein